MQQKCPACHRFGQGKHYGRYHCSACGAHFVLDATGRANRTVWDVSHAPLSALLLVAGCVVVALLTEASDFPLYPVVLLVAFAGWELCLVFQEKKFTPVNVA